MTTTGSLMCTTSQVRPGNVALSAILLLVAVSTARAQIVGGFQQQVGGVWIGSDNILRHREIDETNEVRQAWAKALHAVPAEMKALGLRKISLRRLAAAIAQRRKTGDRLNDEMRFMAGIQHIQYVFVYPQQQDIVLAGPGEGWKLNDQGEVVGLTTGLPVMWLDDLAAALRSAKAAGQTGISCSIDPSDEGIVKLRTLAKQLAQGGEPDIQAVSAAIEETLGMQKISVTGVPDDSHFARVIVAADYRMKRMAMRFEPAPIKGLPSFLDLMKAGPKGMQNMLPRWWLEPNYESLLTSPDGLAYEFRGASVKAVTEEDFVTASGARQRTGKASPVAKKWADNMTAHYDELAVKDAVFGQLRNCIDLAVVGALIVKDSLAEKADCDLAVLFDDDELKVESFAVPREVASKSSVLQKGANWLISASGGVLINSWQLASKTEQSAKLAQPREKADPAGQNWWWN